MYLGYRRSAQYAADEKCTLVICKAHSTQLMKNVPWLSVMRAVCSWWNIYTLVICKARGWWKMYLGYLRSEQYAADGKCTLVVWEGRSTQLMKNVPWLSEKRAVSSWWKLYLGYLRSAQYAADGRCTLVIWEARSAQLMESVPWLSEKRAADEKCIHWLSEMHAVRSWWKVIH